MQNIFFRGGLSHGVSGFKTGSSWYNLKYKALQEQSSWKSEPEINIIHA